MKSKNIDWCYKSHNLLKSCNFYDQNVISDLFKSLQKIANLVQGKISDHLEKTIYIAKPETKNKILCDFICTPN